MLILVANASMGKKQVTILTSYLHSLTTLFHFEWLNSILPCAHTCTELDRGAGGWATAGERATAETQWFTTTPVTPTSLHQDVDVGMECIQEDTGVHFWVDISNMAHSDMLLAVYWNVIVCQPGTKATVWFASITLHAVSLRYGLLIIVVILYFRSQTNFCSWDTFYYTSWHICYRRTGFNCENLIASISRVRKLLICKLILLINHPYVQFAQTQLLNSQCS